MVSADGDQVVEGTNIKVRVPKRVLHFSDGIVEEFSDDEDSADSAVTTKPTESTALIDPKHMTWGPWLMYRALQTGTTALAVCDYIGESLANFFGITTPKYQYELDEYEREQQERKEREAKAEGWSMPVRKSDPGAATEDVEAVTTEQPSGNDGATAATAAAAAASAI